MPRTFRLDNVKVLQQTEPAPFKVDADRLYIDEGWVLQPSVRMPVGTSTSSRYAPMRPKRKAAFLPGTGTAYGSVKPIGITFTVPLRGTTFPVLLKWNSMLQVTVRVKFYAGTRLFHDVTMSSLSVDAVSMITEVNQMYIAPFKPEASELGKTLVISAVVAGGVSCLRPTLEIL